MSAQNRRPFVVANWKINMMPDQVGPYLDTVLPALVGETEVEVGIAAQDLYLSQMLQAAKGTPLVIVGENSHWEDDGAFTGETSPKALAALGVEYVLIGHFERRKFFNETDETVNLKTLAALRNGLKPIVDLDEDLSAYGHLVPEKVILNQLQAALDGVMVAEMAQVTIAYEPTWAIGSGSAASADQAQEAAALIRQSLANLYNRDLANNVRILYGGSVTPKNAPAFLCQQDIDGILVGKAALDPRQFLTLVDQAKK
ncbi:triose-phosphate isomerase [Fructobacillus cardui]|jgi:triosephosphate isomerase (TIM)|uniref:Triosephosphate isomerase n=1 Tax=Fructobacillus cardui TaxID=2893170 RepID=A0ABN9YX36_9LACO|nr:triose-phosphate isomerase [uncultured Fructobacillus sp.]CAK1222434.1 Triosephosphate isomerase (TpiA) [Fructobacillus cardui]CAK1246366.1 Triosephosphate isomerase (TpiA) [Fructobacillus cardui]CAK1251453.1 Triosephosphate isomerase (TpiA) [Fructobacillus cardui]